MLLMVASGDIYAVDHACYHAGAPLKTADIEDIGVPVGDSAAKSCGLVLVCKWHAKKISLSTGDMLYDKVDFSTGETQLAKSRKPKQRLHAVKRGRGGRLYVQDSSGGDAELPSDAYAFSEFKGD